MASASLKQRQVEDERGRGPAPPLPMARVKAIAQQDESIGRMAVEATCIIARCTDAFLADLAKAAAERANATGKRHADKNARKRPATSKSSPQQVLPEDVRQAVLEEERFDFLRPVLSKPPDNSGPLGAAAAGVKGKRKGGSNSGGVAVATAARRGGAQGSTNKKGKGSTAAAASAISIPSDLVTSGSGMGRAAGTGGDLLALAGLDEEGQRKALLGGFGATSSGFGGDEDEDYDV